MSTELRDMIETEKMSNCCGAAMYEMGDNYLCRDCKEWCEAVEPEEDGTTDREFSAEQQRMITRFTAEAEAQQNENGDPSHTILK